MIVRCQSCNKETGQYAPVSTTVIAFCDDCRVAQDQALIDSMMPKLGDPCSKCKTRVSTIQWVGDGGFIAGIHGMWTPYCEHCALEDQLAFARERAAAIPEIERKLKELLDAEKAIGTY